MLKKLTTTLFSCESLPETIKKIYDMGKLYLIPNTLGDTKIGGVIPDEVIALIKT